MAVVLERVIQGYHYINEDLADPRTVDYPLISTPFPVLAIVIFYNVFIRHIGPWWMKDRQPYDLKKVIIAYDAMQVFVNTWMLFRVIKLTYGTGKYSVLCQEVETGTSPEEIMILNTGYCYFIVKLLDLFDTVFFLLSKKSGHMSFLHTYHHSGMVGVAWGGQKYIPGGAAALFVLINTFVHALMYTYYLLAALKYLDSRHIFWKKSLTQLQMIQFVLLALQHITILLSPNCRIPSFIGYIMVPQFVFLFILFADFYRKSYLKTQKTS